MTTKDGFSYAVTEGLSQHGWISPSGAFYGCGYADHIFLAEELCARFYPGEHHGNDAYFLEVRGWLHVSYGYDLGDVGPTQKQVGTVLEHCVKYGMGVPGWVEAYDNGKDLDSWRGRGCSGVY
jgi:hypothetical protein